MLCIGYLIIVNGHNVKKKLVLETSNFKLPRLENCIGTLCPNPFPPPQRKAPK